MGKGVAVNVFGRINIYASNYLRKIFKKESYIILFLD